MKECSDGSLLSYINQFYWLRMLHKLVLFGSCLWVNSIAGQVGGQKNMAKVLRFWKLANLPHWLSTSMQGKVVMQRSVLLVTEHSNTVIIVSVLAHDMSCWHHWSKVKEAIKRVEEEGLHHTNNVKEETERCLRIFLKSRCTVIQTFLAIFPTTPKSYATIFLGVQTAL